jgi:peptidyl-dipeptidase Dcp
MKIIPFLLLTSMLLTAGCTGSDNNSGQNPLLEDWDTPYGVPPFDRIQDSDYLPAFRLGMEQEAAEVRAIATNPEPPTFANTIEALERSGSLRKKVENVFYAVHSANSSDVTRETAGKVAPELAANADDIRLNAALFDRVRSVYDRRDSLTIDAEGQKLLEEKYKYFVRGGATLDDARKDRLREINGELARLTETFSQNLLAETNAFTLHITDPASLGNLPESLVAAASEAAAQKGFDDGWLFTLSRPSINPFLQYSPDREARRKMFMGYAMRANNGNENDNNAVLARIALLRQERAAMLGYASHAAYILSDNMAETPERVYDLLDQVWTPGLKVATRERDELQAMMHSDGVTGELEGWDWRYYTEKIRKARYDFDEDSLSPYFEVSAVRDGAFILANRLFGISITPLDNMPVWHPDQQVYEVRDADGSHLGVLYMDFFTRASKNGGAWMNELRNQSSLDGDISPIVTTNFNFPPPTASTPSLLTFGNAQTLFHEFGHALHGLFSKVRYESLSGTHVPRDYVEFPSQVMENWTGEPEVLRLYAKHYETGEVIPDELIGKIKATDTFNQGFLTIEYMAAAYLDMAWHTEKLDETVDPSTFEKAAMDEKGLIPEIIPRYRSTYFSHIFGSDPGYSAGYYSYLWSEVLDADAFEAFKETSLFDQETASRYRRLLSMGGSRPGMELYEAFRGRPPVIGPLLKRRGLN